GERNEGWDLLVYNYAAAIRLGVNRWGEANWLECERILTQSSLFAPPIGGEESPDPYCKAPDLGEDPPLPAAAEAGAEQAEVAVLPVLHRAAAPPAVLPARPVAQQVRRAVARSAYLR
ncbi:MAG: hypothetical protein B7X50_12350, partial [Alishewanella sp. 34-51-39]